MTKEEMLRALEPFFDEVRVVVSINGAEPSFGCCAGSTSICNRDRTPALMNKCPHFLTVL